MVVLISAARDVLGGGILSSRAFHKWVYNSQNECRRRRRCQKDSSCRRNEYHQCYLRNFGRGCQWIALYVYLVCPILCALAAACRSFCGLKSLSTNITVSADAKFKPCPPRSYNFPNICDTNQKWYHFCIDHAKNCLPALVLKRKIKVSSSWLKFFTARYLSSPRTEPSRRS